jgi:hypothetical protein
MSTLTATALELGAMAADVELAASALEHEDTARAKKTLQNALRSFAQYQQYLKDAGNGHDDARR